MRNSSLRFLIYLLFRNKKAKLKKKIIVQAFNTYNFSFFFSATKRLYNTILNKLNFVIYNKKIRLLLRMLHLLDSYGFFSMGSLFCYFKLTSSKYFDIFNLTIDNKPLFLEDYVYSISQSIYEDVLSLLILCSVNKKLISNSLLNSIVALPTKKTKYTVLRSPHTDKKSREQFALSVYKQIIYFSYYIDNDLINLLIKYFEFYTKISYKTYSS
jgi:hypothetical protein